MITHVRHRQVLEWYTPCVIRIVRFSTGATEDMAEGSVDVTSPNSTVSCWRDEVFFFFFLHTRRQECVSGRWNSKLCALEGQVDQLCDDIRSQTVVEINIQNEHSCVVLADRACGQHCRVREKAKATRPIWCIKRVMSWWPYSCEDHWSPDFLMCGQQDGVRIRAAPHLTP